MTQVIAVVGPFRSGTSCVAGMLHTLGVSMGKRFPPNAPVNAKGFFEAVHLRRICAWIYPNQRAQELAPAVGFDQRVQMLKQHIGFRMRDGNPLGVKHPNLCLMVPEMVEAWPGVRIVSVTRGMDSVVTSMNQPGLFPRMPEEQRRSVASRMIATRDADIARLNAPCLCLNFADVLDDPQRTVDQLVAFAGISPTTEQTAAAVAFVDKSLCHFDLSEVTHG